MHQLRDRNIYYNIFNQGQQDLPAVFLLYKKITGGEDYGRKQADHNFKSRTRSEPGPDRKKLYSPRYAGKESVSAGLSI